MQQQQNGFVPAWVAYVIGGILIVIGVFFALPFGAHLAAICFGVILIAMGLIKTWRDWRETHVR